MALSFLADTLRIDDGGGGGGDQNDTVKEDISELKQTVARQLWGVASFFAPPPPPPPPVPLSVVEAVPREQSEEESEYVGDVGGFLEYSTYEEDDRGFDAVGVTEEVLAFAKNIAHHPETWLDFPIEEEDLDDFETSDAQQKHAFAVEHLAPRLAALRIELCPIHMSEGYFWMVYFVLLHIRLNKHDAELLSTPQLVEARTMWMQELQKKTTSDLDYFGNNTCTYSPREDLESTSEDGQCRYRPQRSFAFEPTTTSDIESEKLELGSTDEVQFIDKVVVEEDPPGRIIEQELSAAFPTSRPPFLDYDEHEDDWLHAIEESEGYSGTSILLENEDISFSDLEDDI